MATQAEVAVHLAVSQAAVSQMMKAKILPAAERGALDLDACRNAYIRHLRDAAAGRGAASDEDNGQLTAERVRYARAQADALEMKNDLAARRVAPIDVTVAMVAAKFQAVRSHLLVIPSKAAPAVFQCKTVGQVFALLTQHIHEAMEELSHGATDDPGRDPQPDEAGGKPGDGGSGRVAVQGKSAGRKQRG